MKKFFWCGALAFLVACGGKLTTTNDNEPEPDAETLPPSSDAACENSVDASCGASTESLDAWSLGGSAPSSYQAGFDSTTTCNGEASLRLASSTASPNDFGEMGRDRAPASWLGHRVRLSGWVRTSAVTGWAGLWMRVDSAQSTGIAFDNMQCRAITGTTDWTRYEVVLDVATNATNVAYGVLLAGQGSVWLDDVSLDVVDACEATTSCP